MNSLTQIVLSMRSRFKPEPNLEERIFHFWLKYFSRASWRLDFWDPRKQLSPVVGKSLGASILA